MRRFSSVGRAYGFLTVQSRVRAPQAAARHFIVICCVEHVMWVCRGVYICCYVLGMLDGSCVLNT